MKKQTVLLLMPLLLAGSVTACKTKKSSDTSTGSSSDTVPVIVDKKVNKTEFVKAFKDVLESENETIDFSAAMIGESETPGTNSGLASRKSQKIDGKKVSCSESVSFQVEITKEGFEAYYEEAGAKTPEEKKAAYDEILEEFATFIIYEQSDEYLLAGMTIADEDSYGEKIDELFVYDFLETDYAVDQYYKSKVFIEESDSYDISNFEEIVSILGTEDMYELLAYDTNKGVYTLELTTEMAEIVDGAMEIEDGILTFDFADKELMSIAVEGMTDEGNIKEAFSILDRGETEVTLPTNILTCDHESVSSIYSEYCGEYHYSYCDECESVINYEAHTYTHDVCTKCQHIDDRTETCKYLGLEDEHMNSHFSYWETANDNYRGTSTDGLDWNYDSTTGNNIMTCKDGECDLKIVEIRGDYERDSELKCLEKCDYTYEFYHGDAETPFKTLELTKYTVYHNYNYDNVQDPENPCKYNITKTCSDCGLTSTYYECSHNYESNLYADGCMLIQEDKCKDCEKERTYRMPCHKDIVIGEGSLFTGYQCHCNECGEDYVASYSFSRSGSFGHYVYNSRTHLGDIMPHIYDEEGECTLCGYTKSETDKEYDFIHNIYEGEEYIALEKDSEGNYVSIRYRGFVSTYDEETGKTHFEAVYSDYNFDMEMFLDEESQYRTRYTIRDGEQVVVEFVA